MDRLMATHAWRCSKCKRPLGVVNQASDVLYLRADAEIIAIEYAQIGTLIQCQCTGVRAFSSGTVAVPDSLVDVIQIGSWLPNERIRS
jgi:hypothetical protein